MIERRANQRLGVAKIVFISLMIAFFPISEVFSSVANKGKLILEDDFNDASSGWSILNSDAINMGYDNGKFRIEVSKIDTDAITTVGKRFSNVIYEASIEFLTSIPSIKAIYGIVCRVQSNGDGYYFTLGNDGGFAVLKKNDGSLVGLDLGFINEFYETRNNLEIICNKSNFQFRVNGIIISKVSDSTFTNGDIGLFLGTLDDVPAIVEFEEIKLWSVQATIEEALDENNNHRIDDVEILHGLQLWITNQAISNTIAQRVDDEKVFELIRLWIMGEPV